MFRLLHWNKNVYIPWPTLRNWQWGVVKNDTLWQKRWFQFSHCEHSIYSNIPTAPAYGVYLSQLIRYSRAYGSYEDFLDRGFLLTRKLLNQWFLLVKLKSSLRKFYGRQHDLVDRYGISVSQLTHGYVPPVVNNSWSFPHSWHITGFVASGAGAAYPFGAPEFTPGFSGVRVTRSLLYLYCVCFVDCCLSFFFWPLCCLFFFDLLIRITPLVSSDHCVVCSSLIYWFGLPLWYLQTLHISNLVHNKHKT